MKPQSRYTKGQTIAERYEVRDVRMGAMGEVYLCIDLAVNYPVALKTFQARFITNMQIYNLFKEEVAIWAAVGQHPHIVRCIYFDTIAGQPFIIMEWITDDDNRSADLRSWLRHGPLDLRTALDFTIQICRGLVHANAVVPGIVHRDLRPENILVGPGPVAKITDFGVANAIQRANLSIPYTDDYVGKHQNLMADGPLVGTPSYMAPEQWRSEALDPRADVYAVGCILYEMLSGESPYRPSSVPQTELEKHEYLTMLRMQHEHAAPPDLQSGSHPKLDNLIQTCLAKRPEERFANADELLQELTSIYQKCFSELPKSFTDRGEFREMDYYMRGVTYINVQRYQEAIIDFTQAITLSAGFADAHFGRGRAYGALERHEEALADFSRAIELNPTDAGGYSNRALTYRALHRDAEALLDYSHAIKLDPNLPEAQLNMGVLLAEGGAREEALPYFEKAATLGLPQGEYYAARARRELGITTMEHERALIIESIFGAESILEMLRVVAQFPFIAEPGFIELLQRMSNAGLPTDTRDALKQRIMLLQQIANEPKLNDEVPNT